MEKQVHTFNYGRSLATKLPVFYLYLNNDEVPYSEKQFHTFKFGRALSTKLPVFSRTVNKGEELSLKKYLYALSSVYGGALATKLPVFYR